jgi:hypothetical protein
VSGACGTYARRWRGAQRILVRKLEGTKQLGRPRCRLEDNIEMDFQETGWKGVDSIHLTQDRDSGGLF